MPTAGSRLARWLEVVGPQHPQVMLDQLRTLLLDDQAARPELRIGVLLVLLNDGLDGLRLDPGLRWVIDSARQVTVGVGHGLRLEQAGKQPHRFPFSDTLALQVRHYPARLE